MEYLHRESRSLQAMDWKNSKSLFQQLVTCLADLAELHLKQADPKTRYSSVLQLRRLIKQAEDHFFDTPEYSRLKELLQLVEQSPSV